MIDEIVELVNLLNTYFGIVCVVFNNLLFIQPATITILQCLRKVPMIKRLQTVKILAARSRTRDRFKENGTHTTKGVMPFARRPSIKLE